MRTNFVLIDSENVKTKYIEKLKHEHFRVVVFVGANLKRLNFPIVGTKRLYSIVRVIPIVRFYINRRMANLKLIPFTSDLESGAQWVR